MKSSCALGPEIKVKVALNDASIMISEHCFISGLCFWPCACLGGVIVDKMGIDKKLSCLLKPSQSGICEINLGQLFFQKKNCNS